MIAAIDPHTVDPGPRMPSVRTLWPRLRPWLPLVLGFWLGWGVGWFVPHA